jgi:hypothetical protein
MGAAIGRALVIGSVGLLFLAYANFAPTALASASVADYVKNHFVREIIFGIALAAWTIRVALQPMSTRRWTQLAVLGSIVILPFWISLLFGWSVSGMEEVWGGSVGAGSAYALHGSQVVLFYVGLALLRANAAPPPH